MVVKFPSEPSAAELYKIALAYLKAPPIVRAIVFMVLREFGGPCNE